MNSGLNVRAALRRFEPGGRVRVIDEDSALSGFAGTVWRVCIGGLAPWNQSPDGTINNIPEAWVRFDARIPSSERVFPATDSRGNCVKMRADQCAREARTPDRAEPRRTER